MNKLLAENKVQKKYWAIVGNKPPKKEDRLVHWLKRNPKQNKSYAHETEVNQSKRAELSYKWVKSLDRYQLLEIELKTGRHHQIRSQLAAIGLPIKGDLKYGAPRSNKDGSIHLHARSLTFVHPVSKEPISVTAPVPPEVLWEAC